MFLTQPEDSLVSKLKVQKKPTTLRSTEKEFVGLHVEKYMKTLRDSDKEGYTRQFSKWDAALKKANVTSLEKLYTQVHDAIRKNPAAPARKERKQTETKYLDKARTIVQTAGGKKYRRDRRFTLEQRKKNVQTKISKALK